MYLYMKRSKLGIFWIMWANKKFLVEYTMNWSNILKENLPNYDLSS